MIADTRADSKINILYDKLFEILGKKLNMARIKFIYVFVIIIGLLFQVIVTE